MMKKNGREKARDLHIIEGRLENLHKALLVMSRK